jgi:ferritin
MLSKRMEEAINDQIKWEFFSGYLYLSMAAFFEDMGLSGFAKWMEAQTQEELFHGMKMYRYVFEHGGRVTLQAVEQPPDTWESPLAAFQNALEHEQLVTSRINALMDLAMEERDHATMAFMQWFVTEQVEEESSVGEVVDKLKLVADGGALYLLDKELGARVFTPPQDQG